MKTATYFQTYDQVTRPHGRWELLLQLGRLGSWLGLQKIVKKKHLLQ